MTDLQNYSFPSLSLQTNDGSLQAFNIVADLVNPFADLSLEIQEGYCRVALDSFQSSKYSNPNATKYLGKAKASRKIDKKASSTDIFAKLNSYTINQLKNQAMRFGLDESKDTTPVKPGTGFFKGFSMAPGNSSNLDSREYEDVLTPEILQAPICEMCIIQQGDSIPEGFFRMYKTPGNKKANLNTGSGGNGIYLCIKKDLTGQIAPITNVVVVFPDRNEGIPPGYHVLHRGTSACNLNTGTSAERVYLCYKKDFLSNPITDIQIIFPTKGETTPKSFLLVDKSVSGFPANLNIGTGGQDIFFTYRQDLIRFGCLLNEVDAEGEKLKRRYTRHVEMEPSSSGNRRGSIADVIMQTRSRSRSPVPRRRGRSGDSDQGNQPASKATPEIVLQAKNSLAEDEPNFEHNVDEIEVALKEAAKFSHVVPEVGKLDESQEILNDAIDEWPELPEELLNPKEMEQATLRRTQEVVDASGERIPVHLRKSLLAILSAVYIRHGTLWDIALSGLFKLFKDTDFFEKDLAGLPLPATVTMLDLTIEAVCDRFDLSPESDYHKLLEFLRVIIKHSGARLAPFSLQRMFKAISFVCSIHAGKTNWIQNGLSMPCNDPTAEISPFRVLKQLLCDTVAQVETVEVAQYLPDSDYFESSLDLENLSQTYLDIRMIVEDLIDDVIDSVEVSRLSEGVMQTISKQSITLNTSAFWHSMNSFSRKLFSDPQHRSAFMTLSGLCKQAWLGIRKSKSGEWIPRDLGSKLVALEALMEFCSCPGDKMRASKIMGYQIRRVVVPCIMFNAPYALCDHRIFSKLLKVISALWKYWRRHIRIEFAILCEQIVFKVLQATVIQIRPMYQMIAVQEVENWFDQPHILIEMFVNYDMDRKFVSHWNTFSYLVRSMCAIGRRLSLVTGAWDWKPGGPNSQPEESNKIVVTIRDVHLQALHEVSRMAKTLMDASGHAFLIMQDTDFRNRSLGENAGWVEDDDTLNKEADAASDQIADSNNNTPSQENSGRRSSTGRGRAGSIRLRRAAHQESEELIKQAIKIYNDKSSLKKAVEYLLSKGFMPDTPQEIANFLRVYKNSFDPAAIGDFLGEGGTNPIEEDYWAQIRFRYTRAVSFVEMEIESALRLYLTGCGFRLPGEAQKIDRFVDVFVKAYWQDNSGTSYCPFKHPDTVHLLSYAIIMLNTDLHRANTDKTKNKKMTKEEFTKNLRGIDQGTDVNKELLSQIYDSIQQQPIELSVKSSELMTSDGKTPADDMVNTVLSQNTKNSNDIRLAEEKKFIRDLSQTLRDSEDLLRSLSPFTYRFHLTNVDTKISLDLVSYMYETVWFHFHAIVEGIFNAKGTDMDIKFAALDVLCYCLTSAIFLNLKVERMAFAILLKRFRKQCEDLPHVVFNTERDIPDDSWYEDVENATAKNTMEIISKLHHLMVHIKDTIQEATNYELTRQIAAKFEKKARILENNLFFIKQGDLLKLSRAGKSLAYKFFLFSDHLIYAHVNMKNQFVVHEQLSLSALSVNDIDTDNNHTSFYISHPIKSFVVLADSPVSKLQWIREINQAIINCKKRETMQQEGPLNRRMSMFSRIEDQQEKLVKENQTLNAVPSSANRRRQSYRSNSATTFEPAVAEKDDEDLAYQAVPFSLSTSPVSTETRKSAGSDKKGKDKPDYDAKKVNTPSEDAEIVDVHIAPCILQPEDGDNDDILKDGTPQTIPTPEERALKQQENRHNFESIVNAASEELLNSLFVAGTNFWKGTMASRGSLTEVDQVKLHALQKIVKFGPYPTDSADRNKILSESFADSGSTSAKIDAHASGNKELIEEQWKELGDVAAGDAKKLFLRILISLAPYWKWEQFVH